MFKRYDNRDLFEGKALTDTICSSCGKTIAAGKKMTMIVRWNDAMILNYEGGKKEEYRRSELYSDRVSIRLRHNPFGGLDVLVVVRGREQENWTLKDAPEIKVLHPRGCGISNTGLGRRVPGSFEQGKRR